MGEGDIPVANIAKCPIFRTQLTSTAGHPRISVWSSYRLLIVYDAPYSHAAHDARERRGSLDTFSQIPAHLSHSPESGEQQVVEGKFSLFVG